MQPEVATGETTTFPSTSSALTEDAPQMHGASSRPARVACAAESRDADLVVVGTRGHGGIAGSLLGSVSADVIRRSKRPVVVVHKPT
jgi:nucleotide-binding universal stress UspA family protein